MSAGTNAANTILTVDGLAVSFGGLAALSKVSFVVREGEVTSLIGPNGAGKSTTIKVLATLLQRFLSQILSPT